LILTGSADILVKGTRVASRSVNDVVGEMAAVDPGMRRSADVTATEEMVVAQVSEAQLADVGARFPEVFKHIAVLMAQKLYERRNHVRSTSSKLRIFIICSAEAIEIGRAVHNAFAHDDFDVIPWYEGVFRATSYTLQTLEGEVDKADFAIAIAHADDVVEYRETDWPAPRDNVIFELGLFMGRLGRERAILLEPRNNKVRLPSDLAGVTTITYKFDKANRDRAAQIAPACNDLRNYVREKGPRGG
jgi:predicted nucleotide-binding protein